MNQAELINAILAHHRNICTSKVTIKNVLDTLADIAAAQMQKGEELTLPGIGKLSIKHRPAKTGRNPATGASMEIPAKNVPHFSTAKALKDAAMSN
jgi:DNA-binding protein HU-beta